MDKKLWFNLRSWENQTIKNIKVVSKKQKTMTQNKTKQKNSFYI